VVIFLPGGLMEGFSRLSRMFGKSDNEVSEDVVSETQGKAEGEK